jgi:predicted nucleic acid-binding protein
VAEPVLRVFLDANVLFTAAHNPDGKAALVIKLARRGYWEATTSTFAVEEARRNLERKFPERLAIFERLLDGLTTARISGKGRCTLALPEKDQPIFVAAREVAATHLLTGDIRHFGPFMNDPAQTGGIVIQRVAEFLELAAVIGDGLH